MRLPARLRLVFRSGRARLLQTTGLLWWAKRQLRQSEAVLVLTFHRVLNDTEFRDTASLPGMVIRRRTFERLAGYVAGRYKAVDFEQALAAPAGKIRVMFTFDDGWMDNYTNALPAILSRGIPASIFVCPGLLGRSLPFWPEQVASLMRTCSPAATGGEIAALIEILKTYTPERRQKFIAGLVQRQARANDGNSHTTDRTASWDEIREMNNAGVTFGCHTQTHQILTTIPAQAARQEIHNSKRAIESALYKRCELFAYPNGNSSAATRRMLLEEDFAAAFTTQKGAWTRGTDRLAIPRMNVCESGVAGLTGQFSAAMFEYSVFWKAWRAMKTDRAVAVKPRREAALSRA